MNYLITPTTTLSLLFLKAGLVPAFSTGIIHQEKEVNPVENEELFDHLFVHNDRKFSLSANQFFTTANSATNF